MQDEFIGLLGAMRAAAAVSGAMAIRRSGRAQMMTNRLAGVRFWSSLWKPAGRSVPRSEPSSFSMAVMSRHAKCRISLICDMVQALAFDMTRRPDLFAWIWLRRSTKRKMMIRFRSISLLGRHSDDRD